MAKSGESRPREGTLHGTFGAPAMFPHHGRSRYGGPCSPTTEAMHSMRAVSLNEAEMRFRRVVREQLSILASLGIDHGEAALVGKCVWRSMCGLALALACPPQLDCFVQALLSSKLYAALHEARPKHHHVLMLMT